MVPTCSGFSSGATNPPPRGDATKADPTGLILARASQIFDTWLWARADDERDLALFCIEELGFLCALLQDMNDELIQDANEEVRP